MNPEGSNKPRDVCEGRQGRREMERPKAEGGRGQRGGRVEGGVRGQRPHLREVPHGEPHRPQFGRSHEVQARELSLSHRRGGECVPGRVQQVRERKMSKEPKLGQNKYSLVGSVGRLAGDFLFVLTEVWLLR